MIATKTSQAVPATDSYLAHFERLIEPRAGKHPSWVFPIRKAGISSFAELGFPTLQQEDWRFTNVGPITKLPFKPIVESDLRGVTTETLGQFTFARMPGSRLVFINGHYSETLSTLPPLPGGVKAGSLAAALANDSSLLEKNLAQHAQTNDNAFAALNTAFFHDGAFIYVPPGQALPQPVQLLFISTATEAGATTHPRNLIIADRGAQLTVIESYVSTANAPYFTNAVTEFVVGDSAIVEHLKFQDESLDAYHVATLHADLGKRCNFISHSFALGARLSRNNIRTRLVGEGLECVLNGLYLTKGEQLADHHMIVEHVKARCASHEYFNGILDDRSKGVFHGRILVRPEAQKTDAKQTNKNILLSDDATADTKPQLEIYADDVKCTHGATIGQLNPESIFYLRARGIGLDTARQMLIHAFAGEIIDRVKCEPAREEIDKLIWDRLEEHPLLAGKK